MIPPVPRSIRVPIGLAILLSAVVIRIASDILTDAMGAVGRWIAPEMTETRR